MAVKEMLELVPDRSGIKVWTNPAGIVVQMAEMCQHWHLVVLGLSPIGGKPLDRLPEFPG